MTEHLEDNEAFYDEKIAPLMAQIIALCKERRMPHFCVFQLQGKDFNDGDPVMCSSFNYLPETATPALLRIRKEYLRGPDFVTLTVITDPRKKS